MSYADQMRELHESYAPLRKLFSGAIEIATEADAHLTRQAARYAQLEEALSDYLNAQDALDHHKLAGFNAEEYLVLMRRRDFARDVLDAARSALSAPKEQST